MAERRIVAMGGGGFSMEPENLWAYRVERSENGLTESSLAVRYLG